MVQPGQLFYMTMTGPRTDIVDRLLTLTPQHRTQFLGTLRKPERAALDIELNARLAEIGQAALPDLDPIERTDTGTPSPDCLIAEELDQQYRYPTERPKVLKHALAAGYYELTNRIIAPQTVGTGNDPDDYAWFHRRTWEWLYRIGPERPRGLVLCLYRGGGKSSSLEMMSAHVALLKRRRYGLYIHRVAATAGESVASVGAMLTSPVISEAFPDVAAQYVSETGKAKDWRQGRIRTGSGFTLDAAGMDQALRGKKIESDRPGWVVLDDLEDITDTPYTRNKKLEIVSKSILQAGAEDMAVIYIQNLIHEDTIMAQVLDRRTDLMATAERIGPVPMIEDLEYDEQVPSDDDPRRIVVTGGEPTWARKGLEQAETEINSTTLNAYLTEIQHETDVAEGDMFPRDWWNYVDAAPATGIRLVRAWDLAGTEDDGDWTVGALMAHHAASASFYVIDVKRGQWGTSKVEKTVQRTAEADRERYPDARYEVVIEAQPAAAGKAWNERWVKETLVGFKVHMMPPGTTGKSFRADGYSSSQQSGMLVLVRGEWNARWVQEHAQFPDFGRHDDQVDSGAMGHTRLSAKRRRKAGAATAAAQSL